MAVEALKLEYKLGPVLAADLNIGNPRETPTGVKGLFFGTVAVVAEERLLPGDKVMVTFTDPSKSAKAYGKGRTGTARNTRRPLIYVKYTPTVSSTRLLTHIRAVLTDPKLYAQIAQSNKKSAQAWMNAVRTIFADDMLKISLAMRVLTQRRLFRPDESAGELFGTNGEELSSDEITIRMAQWLHAIPMTRRTQDIRDRSNNGSAGWEQTYIDILNTIYFDGKNKAYEFGYRVRGNTAESDARDLTTGHLRGTEAGNVLYMQINSATQRLTAEFAADNDTKSWVRGVTIVGGRQGSNAVLLITQTQL